MQTVCIVRVKEVHLIGVGLDTHWKRSHVWYIQVAHDLYSNSFTFSSRHNVMFAAKHSLHTDDGSPYMICTNQEDSVISDWGGAPT